MDDINTLRKPASWWPDVICFLAAPSLSLLISAAGSAEEFIIASVLWLPIPLAIVLGARLAMRAKIPLIGKVFLGVAIAFMLYIAICALSMLGCTLGGGSFNLH